MTNLFRTSLVPALAPIFVAMLLAGCNYHVDKLGEQKEGLQSVPDSALIDYALVNAQVLGPKCLTCHSSQTRGEQPLLENYNQVIANLATVTAEVQSNRMPFRRPPLSAEEKDLLAKWVAAGAPERVSSKPGTDPKPEPPPPAPTPTPTPPPTPDPTEEVLDYALVNSRVLAPKCLNCHSITTRKTDPLLDTYAQVKENLLDIQDDVRTGRMPFRRPPLSPEEKDLVEKWIAAGAPEVAARRAPEVAAPGPGTDPEPTPEPPAQVLDYATLRKNVIEPSCLKCHSGATPKAGVNLETYEGIMKNLADVQSDIELDIMPIRSTLTPEQKALILDWIKVGAPQTAKPAVTRRECDETKLTRAFVQFVIGNHHSEASNQRSNQSSNQSSYQRSYQSSYEPNNQTSHENAGAGNQDDCARLGK